MAALVAGLGLTTATAAEVERVTAELFPGGTAGAPPRADVLAAVFAELRRRSSDRVGSEGGGDDVR